MLPRGLLPNSQVLRSGPISTRFWSSDGRSWPGTGGRPRLFEMLDAISVAGKGSATVGHALRGTTGDENRDAGGVVCGWTVRVARSYGSGAASPCNSWTRVSGGTT